MAKIFSKYLDKYFEVSANRVHNDNGTEEDIVTHKSLEDIILNQLSAELGFAYKLEPWPNSHHPVVTCIMSDKTGRQVQMIGEAMPSTLDTDVAKCNPTVIAAQRAFDKAATKYLALESKAVIKDEEKPAPVTPAAPKTAEKPETIKTSVVSKSEKAPVNAVPLVDEDLEVVEDAVIQYADIADIAEEEFATADEPEIRDIPDAEDSDGDVLIAFGKYAKNPQTVAYLYENNYGWLDYVTTKVTITEANRAQIEAGRRYIALMGKKEG